MTEPRSAHRIKSALIAVLLLLALVISVALTVLASHPPTLLRVGASYTAKIVCSSLYLEGRDPARVLREDVQAPGSPLLELMRVSVDRERGVVRAGFLGFIGDGLAVARGAAGCTLLPDGHLESIAHAGTVVKPSPVPRPQAWPEGEVVMTDPTLERLIGDDRLTGPGTRAVLVVHHRRIVAERYGEGFDAATRELGWSMTKTVTATLIGVLVKEGRLDLDRPTGLWPAQDPRAAIRIADLLSMTSGLKFNEAYGSVSDVTRMLFLEPDMAGFARGQPLEHPVGSVWSYSSGTAVILSRLFEDAAGPEAIELVRTRLFQPLGMQSAVIETDEHGTLVGSSYMYATPRDWARFGEFLLEQGTWQGSPLLPPGYVERMRRPVAASKGQYGSGMLWLWGSDEPDQAYHLPPDTFWMLGHDGQSVTIVPSRALVIVRMGLTPSRLHFTAQPLVQAVLKALPP